MYQRFKKIELKTMRNFTLVSVAAMLLSVTSAQAQDIITLKTGDDIEALVEKVGEVETFYKKWDNQTGSVHVVRNSEVFMIKYQNGSKVMFNTIEKPAQAQVEQAQQLPITPSISVTSVTPSTSITPIASVTPLQTDNSGYQQALDGGFSIHLGGAFPVGYFGDDSDADKALGAGAGFNVGLKGKIPLSAKGLGITISSDFIFNGYKGAWKDMWDEIQTTVERAGGTFTRPRYINVPVFLGLNYKYGVNKSFGVWGEAGLGPNFRTMTTSKTTGADGKWAKVKCPVKTSFGFQIGAGIMLSDFFSIGAHYYGLGTAKIKTKTEYSSGGGSETDVDHTRYSQNLFMVRLGFHFQNKTKQSMAPQVEQTGYIPDNVPQPPRHPAEPDMVFVEGGTFTTVGTAHEVTLSDFYIGKYVVTQAQWKAVMGNNPSHFNGKNLPITNVSLNDVYEFIKRLNSATGKNYRLPTEAEWEFAARGGTADSFCQGGCKYSGSNNIKDVAWYFGNSQGYTHPVGKKRPNELGIYDMSGNIWEWCYCYDSEYSSYVLRGGFYNSKAWDCLLSERHRGNNAGYDHGFRLVLVP